MPAVNVYLTEEEYIQLVNIGKDKGCKASEILQEAVKAYLKPYTASSEVTT